MFGFRIKFGVRDWDGVILRYISYTYFLVIRSSDFLFWLGWFNGVWKWFINLILLLNSNVVFGSWVVEVRREDSS